MDHYESGQSLSKIESQELTKVVEQIQHDPQFDPKPGLRAVAVAASIENQPEKAYKLWEALTELDADDANALFNAGYWAQKKAESFQGGEAIKWFNLAGERYRRALNISADLLEAANNWGNVLAAEAQELAKSNLLAARKLWSEADEKYQLGLSIKPDSHKTEANWGVALSREAQELAKCDLDVACKLWQEAGKKFQRALSIKPDFYVAIDYWGTAFLNEANVIVVMDRDQANELRSRAERLLLPLAQSAPEVVAYNLACVYGQRCDVSNCLHWLKTAQAHNKLVSCEHLQTDVDLDAVRNHPVFQAWLQSICPR